MFGLTHVYNMTILSHCNVPHPCRRVSYSRVSSTIPVLALVFLWQSHGRYFEYLTSIEQSHIGARSGTEPRNQKTHPRNFRSASANGDWPYIYWILPIPLTKHSIPAAP